MIYRLGAHKGATKGVTEEYIKSFLKHYNVGANDIVILPLDNKIGFTTVNYFLKNKPQCKVQVVPASDKLKSRFSEKQLSFYDRLYKSVQKDKEIVMTENTSDVYRNPNLVVMLMDNEDKAVSGKQKDGVEWLAKMIKDAVKFDTFTKAGKTTHYERQGDTIKLVKEAVTEKAPKEETPKVDYSKLDRDPVEDADWDDYRREEELADAVEEEAEVNVPETVRCRTHSFAPVKDGIYMDDAIGHMYIKDLSGTKTKIEPEDAINALRNGINLKLFSDDNSEVMMKPLASKSNAYRCFTLARFNSAVDDENGKPQRVAICDRDANGMLTKPFEPQVIPVHRVANVISESREVFAVDGSYTGKLMIADAEALCKMFNVSDADKQTLLSDSGRLLSYSIIQATEGGKIDSSYAAGIALGNYIRDAESSGIKLELDLDLSRSLGSAVLVLTEKPDEQAEAEADMYIPAPDYVSEDIRHHLESETAIPLNETNVTLDDIINIASKSEPTPEIQFDENPHLSMSEMIDSGPEW